MMPSSTLAAENSRVCREIQHTYLTNLKTSIRAAVKEKACTSGRLVDQSLSHHQGMKSTRRRWNMLCRLRWSPWLCSFCLRTSRIPISKVPSNPPARPGSIRCQTLGASAQLIPQQNVQILSCHDLVLRSGFFEIVNVCVTIITVRFARIAIEDAEFLTPSRDSGRTEASNMSLSRTCSELFY